MGVKELEAEANCKGGSILLLKAKIVNIQKWGFWRIIEGWLLSHLPKSIADLIGPFKKSIFDLCSIISGPFARKR